MTLNLKKIRKKIKKLEKKLDDLRASELHASRASLDIDRVLHDLEPDTTPFSTAISHTPLHASFEGWLSETLGRDNAARLKKKDTSCCLKGNTK